MKRKRSSLFSRRKRSPAGGVRKRQRILMDRPTINGDRFDDDAVYLHDPLHDGYQKWEKDVQKIIAQQKRKSSRRSRKQDDDDEEDNKEAEDKQNEETIASIVERLLAAKANYSYFCCRDGFREAATPEEIHAEVGKLFDPDNSNNNKKSPSSMQEAAALAAAAFLAEQEAAAEREAAERKAAAEMEAAAELEAAAKREAAAEREAELEAAAQQAAAERFAAERAAAERAAAERAAADRAAAERAAAERERAAASAREAVAKYEEAREVVRSATAKKRKTAVPLASKKREADSREVEQGRTSRRLSGRHLPIGSDREVSSVISSQSNETSNVVMNGAYDEQTNGEEKRRTRPDNGAERHSGLGRLAGVARSELKFAAAAIQASRRPRGAASLQDQPGREETGGDGRVFGVEHLSATAASERRTSATTAAAVEKLISLRSSSNPTTSTKEQAEELSDADNEPPPKIVPEDGDVCFPPPGEKISVSTEGTVLWRTTVKATAESLREWENSDAFKIIKTTLGGRRFLIQERESRGGGFRLATETEIKLRTKSWFRKCIESATPLNSPRCLPDGAAEQQNASPSWKDRSEMLQSASQEGARRNQQIADTFLASYRREARSSGVLSTKESSGYQSLSSHASSVMDQQARRLQIDGMSELDPNAEHRAKLAAMLRSIGQTPDDCHPFYRHLLLGAQLQDQAERRGELPNIQQTGNGSFYEPGHGHGHGHGHAESKEKSRLKKRSESEQRSGSGDFSGKPSSVAGMILQHSSPAQPTHAGDSYRFLTDQFSSGTRITSSPPTSSFVKPFTGSSAMLGARDNAGSQGGTSNRIVRPSDSDVCFIQGGKYHRTPGTDRYRMIVKEAATSTKGWNRSNAFELIMKRLGDTRFLMGESGGFREATAEEVQKRTFTSFEYLRTCDLKAKRKTVQEGHSSGPSLNDSNPDRKVPNGKSIATKPKHNFNSDANTTREDDTNNRVAKSSEKAAVPSAGLHGDRMDPAYAMMKNQLDGANSGMHRIFCRVDLSNGKGQGSPESRGLDTADRPTIALSDITEDDVCFRKSQRPHKSKGVDRWRSVVKEVADTVSGFESSNAYEMIMKRSSNQRFLIQDDDNTFREATDTEIRQRTKSSFDTFRRSRFKNKNDTTVTEGQGAQDVEKSGDSGRIGEPSIVPGEKSSPDDVPEETNVTPTENDVCFVKGGKYYHSHGTVEWRMAVKDVAESVEAWRAGNAFALIQERLGKKRYFIPTAFGYRLAIPAEIEKRTRRCFHKFRDARLKIPQSAGAASVAAAKWKNADDKNKSPQGSTASGAENVDENPKVSGPPLHEEKLAPKAKPPDDTLGTGSTDGTNMIAVGRNEPQATSPRSPAFGSRDLIPSGPNAWGHKTTSGEKPWGSTSVAGADLGSSNSASSKAAKETWQG